MLRGELVFQPLASLYSTCDAELQAGIAWFKGVVSHEVDSQNNDIHLI